MLCSPMVETAGGSSHDPTDREQQADQRANCPKCGSHDVRRSHDTGLLAGLLRMLGRWPFRCRSCRSRFYRSSPPEDV